MGGAKALTLVRTIPQMGLHNVLAVAAYRLRRSRGWFPASTVDGIIGPLLREEATVLPLPAELREPLLAEAEEVRGGALRFFGGSPLGVGSPPDWFRNPHTGRLWPAGKPWWQGTDFLPELGDIKGIWELSRFDWLLVLARAARASADQELIRLAIDWARDWIERNPVDIGPNWKCGQETSIRLMQTLLAALVLGQEREPTAALKTFARLHLARIAQTRSYAEAQDNNHATSEAFALFAGGAWLAAVSDREVARWAQAWSGIGRQWLERAVARLVFEDGGFSQYSVSYHRVMLETLSHAEFWRRHLGTPPFRPAFYVRAQAATRWLGALTNAKTGDAPNLGANDGAHPYRLDSAGYRDFRPSVQLAACLFCGAAAFDVGAWDEPFLWLGVEQHPHDVSIVSKKSRYFPNFGLALLNAREDGSGAYAFVKVPTDRFRPSQADPLHFDLWSGDGMNLLRDAGSFSYADPREMAYFSGIAAHNTVAFDGREPMPRISRFLFGNWIRGEASEISRAGAEISWSGHYRDRNGASHRRSVTACGDEWLIEDQISGKFSSAALRWRFSPGAATLVGPRFENAHMTLTVEADRGPLQADLFDVAESRTYGKKNLTPGLEARCGPETRRLRTRILLK